MARKSKELEYLDFLISIRHRSDRIDIHLFILSAEAKKIQNNQYFGIYIK